MPHSDTRDALKAGVPIFIGYFPAAVAFGILARTTEVSFGEAMLFSIVVFAGASQFIALNLLARGMGPLGIILTTLLVNFRHFLMSAYLSTRIREKALKYYLPMAFGVTDETFSVMSFTRKRLTRQFVMLLELTAYTEWVAGTLAGFVLGTFMPAVTYGPRLFPFLFFRNVRIPARLDAFLKCIPVAAIGALIIPGAFTATPALPLAGVAGMGFTLLYGLFKGGIIVPVLGAVVVAWLVLSLQLWIRQHRSRNI